MVQRFVPSVTVTLDPADRVRVSFHTAGVLATAAGTPTDAPGGTGGTGFPASAPPVLTTKNQEEAKRTIQSKRGIVM